jgi:phosphoribosylanthranilate isomerase
MEYSIMIVQIYAIKTLEEAHLCLAAGVDHLGVVVGEHQQTPDKLSLAQAQTVFEVFPASYPKLALTVETDLNKIEPIVTALRPDILHLSGDITQLLPDDVQSLRRHFPYLRVMQAIPVTDITSLDLALAYASVCDMLLLDSKSEVATMIGATGATHDWQISRRIVEQVDIPVILAGGLSPDNVVEAIQAVQPWGVDSNTHTNMSDGSWRKDRDRVERFVKAAKTTVR